MDTRHTRAAALLGLLEPSLPEPPSGDSLRTDRRGHWSVEHFATAVRWSCLCGRSEPILLLPEDSARVRLPLDGIHSCEVCRTELFAARTKTQRLSAWINQHRACLKENSCLEFPDLDLDCKTPVRERLSRRRRFVYEQFWKKTLRSDTYVHLRCQNDLCINPYHLCLTKSPATKLTEEARKLIVALASKGISTCTIQTVLQEQHSIKLSARSIQRTIKGINKFSSCVSWFMN